MTALTLTAANPQLRALELIAERAAGWIPVIVMAYPLIVWPMAFGVAESARGLMDTPTQVQETNIFNRLFFPLAFLMASAAALTVPLTRLRPLLSAPLILLGLYLAWAALSVGWALDPGIALRRLIAQGCLVGALVLSLLAVKDVDRVIRRLFWLIVVAALLNLAVVAVSPPGPLGHEGIYTQKNTLGAAAALTMILALYAMFSNRQSLWLTGVPLLLIALVLMVLSQSKTSLGVAVLAPALAFGLVLASRVLRVSAAISLTLGIGFIVLVYYLGKASHLWDFPTVAGALFGDPTLTSRTDIWGFATEMIARRPIFGYGFESFWGIGHEGPAHREAPGFVSQMPHAHNGYIDVWLQTGIVGLVLVAAFLATAVHAAARSTLPPRLAWLFLTLIVYMIGQNFLESTWFATLSFSWIGLVVAVTLAARWHRGAAESDAG